MTKQKYKVSAVKKYMMHPCHVCDLPLLCQTNGKGEIKFPLKCPDCEVMVCYKQLTPILIQIIDITDLSPIKRWWKFKRKNWFIVKELIKEELEEEQW